MLDGLYAAGAGMEAQQTQLDSISGDIANADTPGYQSRVIGFHDLLYSTDDQVAGSAWVGSGAAARTIGYNQTEGSLTITDKPLDVAIQGPGYLQVRQPDGTLGLTRDGALQVNANGQLTTDSGMPLEPPIILPRGADPQKTQIAGDGTVTIAGTRVGRIGLVTVPSVDALVPSGNGVLTPTAASGAIRPVTGTQLQQGVLEQSNVDLNAELTQMISAEQSYNLAAKAIGFESQMGQIASTLK
jgi:flagellar basal-body rod protein FlgG